MAADAPSSAQETWLTAHMGAWGRAHKRTRVPQARPSPGFQRPLHRQYGPNSQEEIVTA